MGVPLPASLTIQVDYAREKAHGDFSSNIALVLAKKLQISPLQLAEKIKSNIDCSSENSELEKIEIAKPGFINFFLKKSNGDLKLAKLLQIEEIKRRDVSFCTASKESLNYFIPLYKYLRKNGIERNDIFLGVSGSYEYRLHDLENNLTFSYDLTILSLNIIIEYHGEKFHPNIEKYGLNRLKEDKWGKYFRLNLEESITKDINKKQLALKNGFDYLELWSSDSEDINKEKINKLK